MLQVHLCVPSGRRAGPVLPPGCAGLRGGRERTEDNELPNVHPQLGFVQVPQGQGRGSSDLPGWAPWALKSRRNGERCGHGKDLWRTGRNWHQQRVPSAVGGIYLLSKQNRCESRAGGGRAVASCALPKPPSLRAPGTGGQQAMIPECPRSRAHLSRDTRTPVPVLIRAHEPRSCPCPEHTNPGPGTVPST